MHSLTLVGDRALISRFNAVGPAVHQALVKKTTILAIMLQGYVVKNKLSGQVLNVRSGNLRRSIQQMVTDLGVGVGVFGKVYSSGDVKYAAIHEFGGIIKHPGGTKFYIDKATGRAVFIKNLSEAGAWAYPETRPHDIPMPERSFLRSSLKDKQAVIEKGLKDAVIGALRAQVMGKATVE